MPQFFFHARYNGKLVPDNKGIVLSDLNAAINEAHERKKWLKNDEHLLGEKSTSWFEISDDNGNLLVKVAID